MMIGTFKELNKKRQKIDAGRPVFKFDHPVFRSPWFPVFGSVLSGFLLAISFPGFGKSTVVFMALVPLMFAVHSASVKKASLLGLLAGFVFFITSLSWLGNLTGMVAGAGLKISAVLGYMVLALYCALYFIPFALTVALGTKFWAGGNLRKNLRLMFALTTVWVGSEYLRSMPFDIGVGKFNLPLSSMGFPWNPLGVTQYSNPTIIQIAEWGGVSIVSAYIVWMNAAIFVTLRQYTHGRRMKKYRPHFELMIGILPLALTIMYGMNILFNEPELFEQVNVALIQPNIEQEEKWDPEKDQQIRDRLEELSGRVMRYGEIGLIDLIIWPETAIPDLVRISDESYGLVQRVTSNGIPLLVGTMDFNISNGRRTYYNSSVLFGPDGNEIATYNKQHLVPFGEYVPFPSLMRKFTPIDLDFGHGEASTLMPLQGKASFSPLICFEDTVAPLAAKATRAGARWLVNQTNDAWFDPSAQSEQHLAHAVFRCVENRIPMARCCNTGVTCVIDAYGQIRRRLDPRTDGLSLAMLQPRPVGLRETFYTRRGDLFAQISILAGATSLFALRIAARKKQK